MSNSLSSRPTLGQFSSIVCFKSAITGMEEALGEKATAIALISAGRKRGKELAQELGLSNTNATFDAIATELNAAIGANGTHLTAVDKIVQDGDVIKVYCSGAWSSEDIALAGYQDSIQQPPIVLVNAEDGESVAMSLITLVEHYMQTTAAIAPIVG